ncbi:polysaccharide deacetylase family protein [Halobacillus andaensis]|uniref:polysaccharide deacetylase family protein n=1 Tax=Halobacillus andaensis TaxID=1176239 RepID=UPI003D73FB67
MSGLIRLFAAIILTATLFVVTINSASEPVANTSSLEETIKQKAKEYYMPPQDAYIDKVWKKTPGLNGKKVNIKQSYQNMKKDGVFDEKKIVYDEVPPSTSLGDLPPAPIYRGSSGKEMVSFLINVSWGEEYIPEILQVLNKHKIKANFFIDGAFARQNKKLVTMIVEDGHIIGSHGYNHPDFSKLDSAVTRENLIKTNEILEAFTDTKVEFFAPPSGSFTDITVNEADALEMETILWSVDTIDWKKPTKDVLIHRVISKLHNGATILMHPTKVTSESLDELITQIKSDYRIVDFPQLINEKH